MSPRGAIELAPVALSALVESAFGDRLDVVLHTAAGSLGANVRDITHDSKRVDRDSIFCCIVGGQLDGHDYARDAVDAGASALLVQRLLPINVDQVVVPDTRRAMGELSAALYQHPTSNLRVVGITGTNGKTTTAQLLSSIFRQQGLSTAVFGTLSGTRTTPESCELQRDFWLAKNSGVQAVVMEVTSHAMSLQRVVGTRFDAAIFLNLTPEHLDFHHTQEEYFAAKASLFEREFTDLGIVNRDDPYGRTLIDAAEIETLSFGIGDVEDVDVSSRHHSYVWRGDIVRLELGGRFNVLNSLAAATAAASLGVDRYDIIAGLAAAGQVPGRYESIVCGTSFDVIVDYAHTPDALSRVIDTTRDVTTSGGRIILVFGCGGDRDKAKRPMMGRVAAAGSDVVIVTSDNPRTEDPRDIATQITAGIDQMGTRAQVSVELDRRRAIGLALMTARPGDVVIIAGKGHESTQTIGDQVVPFSDATVVRELIGVKP